MAIRPAAPFVILAALFAEPGHAQSADGAVVEHGHGIPDFLTRFAPQEAVMTSDVGLEVDLGGSRDPAMID